MVEYLERWDPISSGGLRRRNRPDMAFEGSFTLGVTELDETNTGHGLLRPLDGVVEATTTTVGNGQLLENKEVRGFIDVVGTGRVSNCWARGPAVEPTGNQRPIIKTTDSTPGTHRNVEFTTVQPVTPSAWLSGIGVKNYHAYRCNLFHLTDGFAVFSQTADGLTNTRGEGNYVHHMVMWQPDYANNNRPETHNDLLQFQGNLGGPQDSVWIGNRFVGKLNMSLGMVTTWTERDCSGVVISLNTQTECNGFFEHNWFEGSVQSFNGGTPDNSAGEFWVINNKFERPGTSPTAPNRALVLNANMTRVTNDPVTGEPNRYYDNGAAVPVGNS